MVGCVVAWRHSSRQGSGWELRQCLKEFTFRLSLTADYIYTGEGKIDEQLLRGKVVIGLSRKAKKKNIPVIAFVGDIGDEVENTYKEGVSAIFSINRVALPYKEQKTNAKSDIYLTIDNLLRYETAKLRER